jgi:hypothetical protein
MMTLRRRVVVLAVLAMVMGLMVVPRVGAAEWWDRGVIREPVFEPWAGDPDTPAGLRTFLSLENLQLGLVDFRLARLYIVPTHLPRKSMTPTRGLTTRGTERR